jgi:glycosyltransferase involved in cell wall biosynthesis
MGPPIRVAPLGLDPAPPLPVGPAPTRDPRHIVMLGTIEPRKNHELALAVWEILAERRAPERMPHLHIIGRAGWRVEGLMARLNGHPMNGRFLHLHGPLPEAETAAHLARAGALLYPSLAEGFGYPPLEALRAGALPICSALPVFRETLGSSAVYVPDFEPYSWVERIEKYLDGSLPRPDPDAARGQDWAAHFGIVARTLAETERRKGPG